MNLENYDFDCFTISLYRDEQAEYLAYFQTLPNTSGFWDSPLSAPKSLKNAWELTKDYYREQGKPIPTVKKALTA